MKNNLNRAVLLVLSIMPAFGQTVINNPPQVLIKNFLYALYQTNQDALLIAKQYIALQDSPNEFSTVVRYQGVAEHLTLLRQGQAVGQSTVEPNKPVLFDTRIDKIVPYKEAKASGLAVSLTKQQEGNVFVLLENGKPLRYFLVDHNKILAFDYMVKGDKGPAYFIGY